MSDKLTPVDRKIGDEAHATEVTDSPTDPVTALPEDVVAVASPGRLMWLKFREHKAALVSGVILLFFYIVAIFAPLVAPHDPREQDLDRINMPPTKIHFVGPQGFSLRPFVYGVEQTLDPETFDRIYTKVESERYSLRLFVRGAEYRLFGFIRSDLHLFGVEDGGKLFVFGADNLGRDLLSRILYGSRISLSIGLVGVTLSIVIGLILGGVSGYYGGTVDVLTQRGMEIIRSFPRIPLWMALSAALPPDWSPVKTYFGITVILSLIGWTGLARVARGKVLSLKTEDFVVAARISAASERRIIFRHLIPSFISHIIAVMTLAIPGMIIGETALSFLGIGLRAPVISWGVLLNQAQNIHTLVVAPWLMIPGFFVIIVVLAFNFLGDGLRDAADPYQ
jgi:peptide/nickel transport system permease protein